MLTPFGVLREPHVASGREPGPGQRVSILDEQVGRRPAIRSRIEVRLHAKMNLRAIKGDETVSAAPPLAGAEAEPAVVGQSGGQVTNRENRRYVRTHRRNLSRLSPRVVRPARVLDGLADLAECEHIGLHLGIEEGDLEGAVGDGAGLPDELVQSLSGHRSAALVVNVGPVRRTRRPARRRARGTAPARPLRRAPSPGAGRGRGSGTRSARRPGSA